MDKVGQMRAFVIRFLYIAIWVGIIYCFLQYALPFVMPFFVAFFIAFLLKPLINLITRKTPLGRKAVAVIVLALFYLIIGTLLVLLGVRLVVNLGELFSALPTYYRNTIEPAIASFADGFDSFFTRLDPAMQSFFESASNSISQAASGIVSAISSGAVNLITGLASSVPWFIVSFLLTIIASFFFVVDYYTITSFIVHQLPENARRRLFIIKDYVINVLFKFARAYLILMTITFVEVSIGMLVLRVPAPFLVALLTAIVDILPVFGTGTVMLPWAAYTLFTGDIFLGIGLLVLYLIIAVVRQFLEPRIVGKQIGLYPLLTLIAMFIGARLFGFWGLFGFPVTLVVLIHLNRIGEISLFKE